MWEQVALIHGKSDFTCTSHSGCSYIIRGKWLQLYHKPTLSGTFLSLSCLHRSAICSSVLSWSPPPQPLHPPLLLRSGNIGTAASPLNLELLLKAPLLLWDTLEAADFLIKAAAECVSAAVCSLWWEGLAKPHARPGDLKKVSDHSRCGGGKKQKKNNQQQEIKYLSTLIIAVRRGASRSCGSSKSRQKVTLR